MTLGVKVRRESAQIGETSTYESASGETRSTFSIKAVLDTRDGSEISMDDAIRKGKQFYLLFCICGHDNLFNS